MRTPRLLLQLGVATLLTAGCTVTYSPESGPTGESSIGVAAQEEPTINPFLGLRAFPGSRTLDRSIDGRDSETVFEANASLRAVYRHVDDQLAASGWRRTSFEVESDEIEAEYERDGSELELELEREDGGVFELEIDVD